MKWPEIARPPITKTKTSVLKVMVNHLRPIPTSRSTVRAAGQLNDQLCHACRYQLTATRTNSPCGPRKTPVAPRFSFVQAHGTVMAPAHLAPVKRFSMFGGPVASRTRIDVFFMRGLTVFSNDSKRYRGNYQARRVCVLPRPQSIKDQRNQRDGLRTHVSGQSH